MTALAVHITQTFSKLEAMLGPASAPPSGTDADS